MSTFIYLIRHGLGETNQDQNNRDANEKIVQRLNTWAELVSLGKKQARSDGGYLKRNRVVFDAVFSSPTIRTQQTARYSLEEMVEPEHFDDVFGGITTSSALLEMSSGEYEGKKKHEINYDALMLLLKEHPDAYWTLRPPGGESPEDVYARVRSFIEEKVLPVPYRTVGIYTHRGPIIWLMAGLFHMSPHEVFSMNMFPGTISRIEYENSKWQRCEPEIFVPEQHE